MDTLTLKLVALAAGVDAFAQAHAAAAMDELAGQENP